MEFTISARLIAVLEGEYTSAKTKQRVRYNEVQTAVNGVGIMKWKFKMLDEGVDLIKAAALQGKDVSLIVKLSTNRYENDAPMLVLKEIAPVK
jgi:hypothetical protein